MHLGGGCHPITWKAFPRQAVQKNVLVIYKPPSKKLWTSSECCDRAGKRRGSGPQHGLCPPFSSFPGSQWNNRTTSTMAIRKTSTTTATITKTTSPSLERMRIAIVGDGVAGLATALHLAELVQRGLVESPIDVFVHNHDESPKQRDIGVGVWSTGLIPFSRAGARQSQQSCWEDWMRSGQWLGEVGYRSPKGTWLAKSTLPTSGSFSEFPGLLFLRECDLIQALHRAVEREVSLSNVQLHAGPTKVLGIVETWNTFPYSAPLVYESGETTGRDYHLIIGAEGTYSNLRQRYGGHNVTHTRLTGTNVFNPPEHVQQDVTWKVMEQADANEIEDRSYSVLRGNANLINAQVGLNGVSFQTWGEGQSMRFATVPLSFPSSSGQRVEKQVWFATTSNQQITNESDPEKRKGLLIQSFSSWHDPIERLMEATPAQEIIMERAISHKHCTGPVPDVHRLVRDLHQRAPLSAGPGPAMVFIGDSLMTVDPILAQGFTMALEGAHAVAGCVEEACQITADHLAFDPITLRSQLQQSHEERCNHRLVPLLRATELVQTLGQPQASLLGFLSKNLIRPAMVLAPNAIKTPIFNAVLKYSLGATTRTRVPSDSKM